MKDKIYLNKHKMVGGLEVCWRERILDDSERVGAMYCFKRCDYHYN